MKLLRNMRQDELSFSIQHSGSEFPASVATLHWNQWTLLRCCPSSSENLWIRKHHPAISSQHMTTSPFFNLGSGHLQWYSELMLLLNTRSISSKRIRMVYQHDILDTPCVHWTSRHTCTRRHGESAADHLQYGKAYPAASQTARASATTTTSLLLPSSSSLHPLSSCISSGFALTRWAD